ncbi:hypothetical protein A4H97_27285 [Niastella yeongjuensis]|uniref:Uncharacterized protein n=1 Tax=Niastella yeongjuensis TaxID=354355 RepID=A0A1V9EZ23_9BACT|nr:DUF4105 domain-containing protein [Niastella yeongjuensis]OQP51286.1 hypothetical protein A4H97_27285 [Niastella yeongjuensis]SEP39245.1 protein of unknown function [Niastella yeongjuensis]
MNLRSILSCLILISSFSTFAQTDTSHLRISLLTCSPGVELYSTFGHTALRVTDSARGVDMAYNYGTFDDRDPNFYAKFTRGIMLYALSNYSYQEFLQEYQYEHRGVIEQELLLTGEQKQHMYAALQENAQEQNRYYNYYFHTDNCTTRARDMIVRQTGASIVFKNILPEKIPTYRNLIHTYLDKSNQSWSKFGIDMCLGSNLDDRVTNDQSMFLPDYLMKGIDQAIADGHPLLAHTQTVVAAPPVPPAVNLVTPMFLFSILFVITGLLSFSNNKWAQRSLNVFDCIFFLFVGIFGILIVTLWAIRVDTVCRNNFNVFWALPTHFLAAFVVYLKRKWLQQYFRIVFVLTLLFTLCWFFIPQQINVAVLPLLGILLMRSYFRGNLPLKKRATTNAANIFQSSKAIDIEL